MKILRETMTRFVGVDYNIRVWRQEGETGLIDQPGPINPEVFRRQAYKLLNESGSIAEWGRKILVMPHVNAVEVLDAEGNGTVEYKDWP